VNGSGISWAIMQVCTLLQTDNHASTSPLSFLQSGCPSCHPTNSVKALKWVSWVSWYQKGKSNLDFTEAKDSEWQWLLGEDQLGHMQVCTSLQTDNHASTQPLSFLQAGCPSCRPINSVKALKAVILSLMYVKNSPVSVKH